MRLAQHAAACQYTSALSSYVVATRRRNAQKVGRESFNEGMRVGEAENRTVYINAARPRSGSMRIKGTSARCRASCEGCRRAAAAGRHEQRPQSFIVPESVAERAAGYTGPWASV